VPGVLESTRMLTTFVRELWGKRLQKGFPIPSVCFRSSYARIPRVKEEVYNVRQ
jgi:hypothetical protein